MIHEEIIASIKLNIEDKCSRLNSKGECQIGCWNCELSQAMIAVLELHKPQAVPAQTYCSECVSHSFPCPTIKAITESMQWPTN